MKPVKFTERELNFIYKTVANQQWAIKAFGRKTPDKGTMTRILNKILAHKNIKITIKKEVKPTSNELPF